MTNTIDLRDYVGKKVQVRYKNGQIKRGVIGEHPDLKWVYNYYFDGAPYSRGGTTYGDLAREGFHIGSVEIMGEEDKYERLIAEIVALRKEVNELLAGRSAPEEPAPVLQRPTLKPMRVTRSFVIQPREYLEYCKCFGEEPSKKGFVDFLTQEMDYMFREEGCYEETVEEVEQ